MLSCSLKCHRRTRQWGESELLRRWEWYSGVFFGIVASAYNAVSCGKFDQYMPNEMKQIHLLLLINAQSKPSLLIFFADGFCYACPVAFARSDGGNDSMTGHVLHGRRARIIEESGTAGSGRGEWRIGGASWQAYSCAEYVWFNGCSTLDNRSSCYGGCEHTCAVAGSIFEFRSRPRMSQASSLRPT